MKRSAQHALDKLRTIDADMLDVTEVEWDGKDPVPTLQAFSRRISECADELEAELRLSQDAERNAKRWDVLYNSPDVWMRQELNSVKLFKNVLDYEGRLMGTHLLAKGATVTEAVDKYLGFL